MQTDREPIVIIGAGMAGLACALELKRAGLPFVVLEAGSAPGGRIRTDAVQGFRLDRGFQVLLTAYPEAQRFLEYDRLQLRKFQPGAMVRKGGKFHKIVDPWREPLNAVSTLVAPVGGFKDKLLVAKLREETRRHDIARSGPDTVTSTKSSLEAHGFSEEFIDSFMRPFFGGIFLERELATVSAMYKYIFGMFSEGYAAVPALGMEAMPAQLAARLIVDREIRLNSPVREITEDSVILKSGETIPCSRVVIATDWGAASRLMGVTRMSRGRSVTCVYFAADAVKQAAPILFLNGESQGLINNLCFPSAVSTEYAPEGRTLVSASIIGESAQPDIESRVQSELIQWFGAEAKSWQHLRTYRIIDALPDQSVQGYSPQSPVQLSERLFVCGDYTENASINGALLSGRKTADALIRAVSHSVAC